MGFVGILALQMESDIMPMSDVDAVAPHEPCSQHLTGLRSCELVVKHRGLRRNLLVCFAFSTRVVGAGTPVILKITRLC